MGAMPNYIVLRARPGVAAGSLDGRWMDLAELPAREPAQELFVEGSRAVPSMGFETGPEGAVAQVYLLSPLLGEQ